MVRGTFYTNIYNEVDIVSIYYFIAPSNMLEEYANEPSFDLELKLLKDVGILIRRNMNNFEKMDFFVM